MILSKIGVGLAGAAGWVALASTSLAAPRLHPGADAALYLPRASAGERLGAFFKTAAQYSPLLEPSSWKTELHPLFPLDFTAPGSLSAWGVDPGGSATINLVGGNGVMACTTLGDPKIYQSKAQARFGQRGEPWKSESRGSALRGVREDGQVAEGYALRGKEACAVSHPTDAERLLKDAAVALGTGVTGPGSAVRVASLQDLPGIAYLLTGGGATFGLDATPSALTVEGSVSQTQSLGGVPALSAGGITPYSGEGPEVSPQPPGAGLLFARALVAPAGIGTLVRNAQTELARACAQCPAATGEAIRAAVKAFETELTGKIALHLGGLDLRGPLASPSARLFAFKLAAVAEMKDSGRASGILESLARDKNGVLSKLGTETGTYLLRLPLSGGGEPRTLQLKLHGRHLIVSNDAAAAEALRRTITEPGKPMTHGAEIWVGGPACAAALGRVSLLDVLGSPELAAAVAASGELRPLLRATQGLVGTMDSRGSNDLRVKARWSLASKTPSAGSVTAP